ncbi:MAG: serine/threonine-protein kinase, partial [Acidobacteriota bacterium]
IPCLVLEFLEGETLADWMERRGTMAADPVREVMLQASRALEAAHRAGVVHRDLKPDNIFLVAKREGEALRIDEPSTWRVVLTDFGVARRRPSGEGSGSGGDFSGDSLTASNVLIGTPDFMAPELLDLEEAIPASDQYALGLVAYELVTGTRPFQHEQPLKALFMRVREPAPSPRTLVPKLDLDLSSAIERCLERRPEDRFPDASALAEALSAPDSGLLSGGVSLRALSASRWRPGREHYLAAAVLTTMLLLVTLLVLAFAEPGAW